MNGWAYAQFGYDAASQTFTPQGSDAKCGYECHSQVSAKCFRITRIDTNAAKRVKGVLDVITHANRPSAACSA